MKKTLLSLLFISLSVFYGYSQGGIFDDSIHTAVNFGSVNSPGAEGVQNVIDQDSSTKFLDFNAADGIGFDVDLLGDSKTAIAIEIVTANDAPERDPTDYEIFGSDDGTNYTSIATGNIPCVSDRFFSRTFSFSNATGYSFYRVNFTGTCGASSINQIADVQLYESIGNPPVINCPANITMNTEVNECSAVVNYSLTANDTEDGALTPTIISGIASGEAFPAGTTEVFASVTDSDNNTISCSFTVTIIDNEDPVASCPSDITETTANSVATTAIVNYTVGATDNCSVINPLTGFTALGNLNGKAYYLSDNIFAPQDAYTDAVSQGGFVGTIRTDDDNLFLSNAISTIGGGDVLIGYNDNDSEGTFVWHSLDASTYNNWNPGEPNNSGASGSENYTVLQFSGGWNDVDDNTNYRYLLELDYVPEQIEGLASGSDFPIGTTTNTFVITDLSGNSVMCSFDVNVEANLSIDDNTFSNNIYILPNPATSKLILNTKSILNLDKISIVDLNGRIIKLITNIGELSSEKSFDISYLDTGVYLLKITDNEGRLAIKRFVKE